MRKLLYLAALLLLAACENVIEVDFGEVEPQMVLNAQLLSSEGPQAVFLSESTQKTIKPLKGADVTVEAGGKTYKAQEDPEWEGNGESSSAALYWFEGGFPAGSEVKVTASKGSYKAWGQATVTQAPAILAVDTLRTTERDMDYTWEAFQVRIRFKDLPGTTYYQVGVHCVEQVALVDEAGEVSLTPENRMELSMSGSNDPVLSGNATGLSIFSVEPTYLVFTDDLFQDQEITLHLSVPMSRLTSYYYYWASDFEPVYGVCSISLIPWLSTITKEEFQYLTALNNLENFGYEAQIIVEPTTIPSNVNGGLGMVAVQARTEAAAIELPPQVFTFFNDEEYYE